MRKLAELFTSSPWMYGGLSALLITLLYYVYTRTLPMTREDVNRSTAKVAAVTLLVNGALAYLVSSGMQESLSAEPFVVQG